MVLTVVIMSMVLGAMVLLMVQGLLAYWYLKRQPVAEKPKNEQYEKARLHENLENLLQDLTDQTRKKSSESCEWLNLILAFLFRELKDTGRIRRWVNKKLSVEFAELVQSKTAGRVMERIRLRDYSFGTTFPIVEKAIIMDVKQSKDGMPGTIDIALDIDYKGGFRLAVDVDLVFGRTAYLSVKVTKLKGRVRLQFSREPFSHWSFSFYEEPELEFDAQSQFGSRVFPQLTSIIINQIRRSVRKKHTLPYYKMRFKPFFDYQEQLNAPDNVYLHDNKVTVGQLEVTIVECSRLPRVFPDCVVYCTLCIDESTWNQWTGKKRSFWFAQDVELAKGESKTLGIAFRDEPIEGSMYQQVVVDRIDPNTPASRVDIQKGDILLTVGGVRVMNVSHAAKLIRQAGDKMVLRIERHLSHNVTSDALQGPPQTYEEDTVSLKGMDALDIDHDNFPDSDSETEEYINISIKNPAAEGRGISGRTTQQKSSPSKAKANISPLLSRKFGLGGNQQSPTSSPIREPGMRAAADDASKATDPAHGASIPAITVTRETLGAPRGRSHSDGSEPLHDMALTDPLHGVFAGSGGDVDAAGATHPPQAEEYATKIETRATSPVTASQELSWDETFIFDIEDEDKYLNICIWAKGVEKGDKEELIGHVSITLIDVALQCLTTLSGEYQNCFLLEPPEIRAAASRHLGRSGLATHPGFNARLCGGDVTLRFHHTPNIQCHAEGEQQTDTKKNTGSRRTQAIRRKSASALGIAGLGSGLRTNEVRDLLQRTGALMNNVKPGRRRAPPKWNVPHLGLQVTRLLGDYVALTLANSNIRSLLPSIQTVKHDFVEKQFTSRDTRCDYCMKKVWTKVAAQCKPCSYICHKKCIEKCQAVANCSKQPRQRSSPLHARKPTTLHTVGSAPQLVPNTSTAHHTSPGSSPRVTPSHSPAGSPTMARRYLSGEMFRETQLCETADSSDSDSIMHSSRTLREKILQTQKEGCDFANVDVDTLIVTAAKELGRDLYCELPQEERRQKLDAMINKLQQEIDMESEHKLELHREEKDAPDQQVRGKIAADLAKSEERLQALALLMLHYCSGWQNCTEREDEAKAAGEQAV
ncbi:PDZ domain-containing protein 8-like isoform X2 [Branchiostoma lanceolatum]|uniref:PDZ domain-containing protein 8-like isoform X2 n=1 Tax=Branchiostoma lanceolatum TaxID=7740 RepID=UPI00345696A6